MPRKGRAVPWGCPGYPIHLPNLSERKRHQSGAVSPLVKGGSGFFFFLSKIESCITDGVKCSWLLRCYDWARWSLHFVMLNRCLLLGYLLLQSSKVGKTDTSTPPTISSVSLQNQLKQTKFCIWSEFPWDLKAHERAFKLCSRWLDFEWLAIVGWVILKVSTIQNSSKFLGVPWDKFLKYLL